MLCAEEPFQPRAVQLCHIDQHIAQQADPHAGQQAYMHSDQ